jgi:hypothetical protein
MRDDQDEFIEDLREALRDARAQEVLCRASGDEMGAARARMTCHRLGVELQKMVDASPGGMLRRFAEEQSALKERKLARTWKNLHKRARG